MNIHLLSDEKFLDNFITNWEKYHENNIYVVVGETDTLQMIALHKDKIRIIQPHKKAFKSFIEQIRICDNLIIHSLSGAKLFLAEEILKYFTPKVFWIYFGAELYTFLEKKKLVSLYDYQSQKKDSLLIKFKKRIFPIFYFIKNGKKYLKHNNIRKFVKNVDYFCFWNPTDYELAKKYLNKELRFKYFIYLMSINDEIKYFYKNSTFENKILINNSSSRFANHITILDKLKKLEIDHFKFLIPLSYGDKFHMIKIKRYLEGNNSFNAEIITDFVTLKSYNKIIAKCKVAIFGAKRQHAGGNIFFMIGIGAKVFLRPENSIYQYLKDKGVHIFDFNDIQGNSDFEELTTSQKELNHQLILDEFSKENEIKAYNQFFNHQ